MNNFFVNSEYLSLKAVLLCRPAFKISRGYSPKKVLHLKNPDPVVMDEEFNGIIALYNKLGIKTFFVDPRKMPNTGSRYLFNLMFTRDHFFMTPAGAILSCMASPVRRMEINYVKRAFKKLGVSVRGEIQGSGTFEGADALWVDPKTVLIGVGNRTNNCGFNQIKEILKRDGIQCVRLPAACATLHMLGAVQLIDKGLAVVRTGAVKPEVVDFLNKKKVKIIKIPENEEMQNKQAFNFVTVAPRQVILPAFCPKTKKVLSRYKVKVLAEVPLTQFINAGGGLACLTGILARRKN